MSERISSYKVHGADGYGIQLVDGPRPYLMGIVRTHLGYVSVYSQKGNSWVSTVHDGYEVTQWFDRSLTKRGLVTVARRFIEEMQP